LYSRPLLLPIALIIAGACLVDTFSVAHDMARGGPYHFWLPLPWEATSGGMIVALLLLPRPGARIAGNVADQLLKTTMLVLALAIAFAAIHIAGMVSLRKLAYAVGGATYSLNWSFAEVLYEARKQLSTFLTRDSAFGLAERARATAGTAQESKCSRLRRSTPSVRQPPQ